MDSTQDSKPHREAPDWLSTPDGAPRGMISLSALRELWIHTGTTCNLECSFCYEGSAPDDTRLEPISLVDVQRHIDHAVALGVKRFSFTGGEPFQNEHFIEILRYALDRRPCFVFTNGLAPLRRKIDYILLLLRKSHPCTFCVSLDYPDRHLHDAGRGEGTFRKALSTLFHLHKFGFLIAVARRKQSDEPKRIDARFRSIFLNVGLPEETPIIPIPELHEPGYGVPRPDITTDMIPDTTTRRERYRFMCSYSRMVVKKGGRTALYACPLVNDDSDYDLGSALFDSMHYRVILRHHRCLGCIDAPLALSTPIE